MNPKAENIRRPASVFALLLLLAALLHPRALDAATVDIARYAWEFPETTGVTSADDLVSELRDEVSRVLDAGRLAPLYISFSDQESVGYTAYQEPGRIVGTLAWAYPHLVESMRARVREYVNTEFANPTNAPWGVTAGGKGGTSNYPLPRASGTPRESHPRERWWFEHAGFGATRPFLHTLYGTWLYGHRSGDWTAISNHWPAIRAVYKNHGDDDAYRLYGTMCVHIAVARMAERFGDAATRADALARLQARMDAGLDFDAVEGFARGKPGASSRTPYGGYPDMYDSRMDQSTHRGWIFLNLSPELGRYLNDASTALRGRVMERHAAGKAAFPLWWMPKASYFNRSWTGDEGSGLVPEVVGMIAPVERWVAGVDAATLARQTRGAPNGTGDCHWIEMLVQAIEATGKTEWRDVRR